MRKIPGLALVLLFSASLNAVASKASLESLQGARFLKNTQTIFVNPSHLNSLGQFLTLEMGDTTNSGSPKAEGGIFLDRFGGKIGLYLGHLDVPQKRLRELESYYIEQNPVELFYAKNGLGISVFYSRDKQNNVTFDQGQKTLGVRLGYSGEKFDVYFGSHIFAKSQKSQSSKLQTQAPTAFLGLEYESGGQLFFTEANWTKATMDISTPVSRKDSNVEIRTLEAGWLDRSLSNLDRRQVVYYGVSTKFDQVRKHIFSTTNWTLPFVIGLEKGFNEWLALRASVSQNFVLGYTRDQTQSDPANRRDTVRNNTTVAAGIGIYYEGITLDGVLTAASTGDLNASSIIAKASLKYEF